MTDFERRQVNDCIYGISMGNTQALALLSELIGGKMLAVAFSVTQNRQYAEDAVQESFIKIAKGAKSFNQNTNGYAWVCKIVSNEATNILRREKKIKSVPMDEVYGLSSDDMIVKSDSAMLLQSAMSVLDDREKKAIYQKYFMEYTMREIAVGLRVSKSQAQRIIESAQQKMKNFLSSRDK